MSEENVAQPKRIYLVRHGETEGNKHGFSQYPTTPLSDRGHEQAKVLAARCNELTVDVLVASDMTRAQETAQYVSDTIGLPITTCSLFHEQLRPFSIRGKPSDAPEYIEFLQREAEHWGDESWRPDGYENYHDLMTRADKAIEFLETQDEQHILVVTHGTFKKCLTGRLLFGEDLSADLCQRVIDRLNAINTGITMFEWTVERGWRLLTWNDHAHFAE